jgi:hypothetical protein
VGGIFLGLFIDYVKLFSSTPMADDRSSLSLVCQLSRASGLSRLS